MLFNSNEFLAFFGLFFAAYLLAQPYLRFRNVLIVLGSYVFYSAWDPRFTLLLLLTSIVDFILGLGLDRARSGKARRALVVVSLVFNLGVLCTFKYFNFFAESFVLLLRSLGWAGAEVSFWEITLPVGISFYTFQSISYIIDVYRGSLRAAHDPIQYMAYVAFFPQLVAGPIERGMHLLPQFARTLRISLKDIESALWLIIWGFFKKVVLSDNLSGLVQLVYQHPVVPGPIVWMGTLAFGLQIYCDFSAYSDIARGIARLMGFDLMLNFNLPYFATNLRDFWGRWHISLSTWLRDYLYIPLGGNRLGQSRTYVNLAITMLLGGLWHGAAANFILWGAWHGIGLIGYHWFRRSSTWKIPPLAGWFGTQLFVLYSWMLFRAESVDQIMVFTGAMFQWGLPDWWDVYALNLAVLAMPVLVIEWWQWKSGNLEFPVAWPRWRRAALQAVLLIGVLAFWQQERYPFIYFQF